MANNLEVIRARLGKDELLAALAEEACELAHAALKLRRALTDANPTPKTVEECFASFTEEEADIFCILKALDIKNDAEIEKIIERKIIRWVKRLEVKEDEC